MAARLPSDWRDLFADDSCPPFANTQEACEAMQEELERTNPPTDTQPPEEGAQLLDHKPEEREEAEKDEEPDEPEKPEKPEETDSSSDDSHNGSYNEPEPEKPEEPEDADSEPELRQKQLQAHSSSDGEHKREYHKCSSRRGAAALESETDEKPTEPEEPEKPEEPEDADSKPELRQKHLQAHSSSDGEHKREYHKCSSRRGAAALESETDEKPTEPEEPEKPEEPEDADSKPELRQKHLQAHSSSDGEGGREYHKLSSRTGALALEDETEEGDDEDTGHQELVPEGGKRQEAEPEAYVVHSSPDTGTTEPAPDAVERARASCKCVLQVRLD